MGSGWRGGEVVGSAKRLCRSLVLMIVMLLGVVVVLGIALLTIALICVQWAIESIADKLMEKEESHYGD